MHNPYLKGGVLLLPTIIITILVIIVANWHIPTIVDLDIEVDYVLFKVKENSYIRSMQVNSISGGNVDEVILIPSKIYDSPPQNNPQSNYRDYPWKQLTYSPNSPIYLKPQKSLSNFTFLFSRLAFLEKIPLLSSDDFILEKFSNTIMATLFHDSQFKVSTSNEFYLEVDNIIVEGNNMNLSQKKNLVYKIEPSLHDRLIKIDTNRNSTLGFELSEQNKEQPLCENVSLADIRIHKTDNLGNIVSSLVSDGKLTYSEFPKRGSITLKKHKILQLKLSKKFVIESISVTGKGIELNLYGKVDKISSYDKNGDHTDYRLTLIDVLWNDKFLIILITIISWVFSTTILGYQLYKDI